VKLAPSDPIARMRRRTLIDIALRRQRARADREVRENLESGLDLTTMVLAKLARGYMKDLSEVALALGAADDAELDRTRASVRERAPEMLQDLDGLIYLGKLEISGTE
jgi:hypothetical protein